MGKKWGQHFLVKEDYAQEILKLAQIKSDDHVLEIGPGQGILTQSLLQTALQVICVEIDPNLCQILHHKYDSYHQWSLVESDVLNLQQQDWQVFFDPPYKIVSNLPYQISSPLFFKLFVMRHLFHSITLMVQKEWAMRLCANVGDGKNYGALSIAADWGFVREYGIEIPPTAFKPPPRVDSALVHLRPKPYLKDPYFEKEFALWVRKLFEYRRKTLANVLRFASVDQQSIETLAKSYDMKRRIESFSSLEIWELFQSYKSFS